MGTANVTATGSTQTKASTRAELENEKRKQAEENKKARENQALQQGLAGDDHLKAAVDRDFNKFCLIPPGEPLVNNVAAQGTYGAICKSRSMYQYATANKELKTELRAAEKEWMSSDTYTKTKWSDAFKESKEYKNNKAYREAVDNLFKKIRKLEKSSDVQRKLYDKMLKNAQGAIKSGDIEQVLKATQSTELAQKTKTFKEYKYAADKENEAAKAAEKETAKAAEKEAAKAAKKEAEKEAAKAAEKEAAKAAEKAAGKTAGKIGLKTLSKCLPYVGNVVFAGMEVAEDWDKLKAAKKKGGGAFAKQCVHTGVKTGAVIAGFALGMKAGAAIGSCIPIPVVGTVVGAVVGGIIGGAVSWLFKKSAKAATKAVLGPEPGVEAQKQELASNPNNKYLDKNGTVNREMYLQSGDHEKLTRLAEYVQVNGTEGLSADTLKVLQYNGYLQSTDGQASLDVAA